MWTGERPEASPGAPIFCDFSAPGREEREVAGLLIEQTHEQLDLASQFLVLLGQFIDLADGV